MKPNPDMLRLARQRKGLHQTQAAKQLGVEQPVLSRIENGLMDFKEEFVELASKTFDVPRSFFFQTDPIYGAPVSVHPMWRKKADVSATEMDIVVAELNLRVIQNRKLLDGADIVFSNNIPNFDIEEYGSASKAAALLRAHWNIPRGPLRDLTLYVERAGVFVAHSPMNGASISGVTFSAPGMPPLIVLNSEQPADRMRFTLAHELGHLVLHRFPNANMEAEANEFASAFLLPHQDIKPYFTGRNIDLALLASLKPEWQVSMQSLLMAASDIVPLTTNQKQYLWKQMSARGYRLKEPPELDFPREMPTVLPNLLKVHMEELGYSFDDLAKLVNLHRHEMEYYHPQPLEKNKKHFMLLVK